MHSKGGYEVKLSLAFYGRMELIIGPMFSGKTTELLRRIRRHTIAGRKSFLVKYASDARYEENVYPEVDSKTCEGEKSFQNISREPAVNSKNTTVIETKKQRFVVTHDGANQQSVAVDRLESLFKLFSNDSGTGYSNAFLDSEVIGIDEGQFFPDLLPICEQFANMGKIVIVAGLDSDFQKKPFGKILDLVSLCDEIVKLSAICACGKEAIFTKRTSEDKEIVVIGGKEKYTPVCRRCYTV